MDKAEMVECACTCASDEAINCCVSSSSSLSASAKSASSCSCAVYASASSAMVWSDSASEAVAGSSYAMMPTAWNMNTVLRRMPQHKYCNTQKNRMSAPRRHCFQKTSWFIRGSAFLSSCGASGEKDYPHVGHRLDLGMIRVSRPIQIEG